MSANPVQHVVRPGNTTKSDPFTIVVVSNPALETPRNSSTFVVDPITSDPSAFDACVQYIDTALFGMLPNQRERFLAESDIEPEIRVISFFVSGLPAEDANSLVAQDDLSELLIARRRAIRDFLASNNLEADVAYAVSKSVTHSRASAWYTSDDDARPGVNFTLDSVTLCHRYYNLIPGTIALHTTSNSLTALHEFSHALSSYSNGAVTDLYVDSPVAVNNKRGTPTPVEFSVYNGINYVADPARNGLGYPAAWLSYHCELIDAAFPAVMDDYWRAHDGIPEHCQHDKITRQFLLDRLRAKIAR